MAPTAKQYDFIVVGGGSGGSGAARRASGWYGAKTLLIENGRLGICYRLTLSCAIYLTEG